jgi:alpha-1,2-mannosyltransferase
VSPASLFLSGATRLTSRRLTTELLVAGFLMAAVLVCAWATARKAAEDRTAYVRWHDLIQDVVAGRNIYATASYPNPPLMALCLYPLTFFPPMVGALIWFHIKVFLALVALHWSIRLAQGRQRGLPFLGVCLVFLISARPILSDLQHGNVNLVILFLIVGALRAYASGRDTWAGLLLALGATFKVTPALFLVYFAWKRETKVLTAAVIGLVVFLFFLPGLVLGFSRNLVLLRSWTELMIEPYVVQGIVETRQINQSLPGLLYRLLTDSPGMELRDGLILPANLLGLSHATVRLLLVALTCVILGWLAYVCRTPSQDRHHWLLAAEYGLVMLAMLFLSERSWKHHYVTIALPVAVTTARMLSHVGSRQGRRWLGAALASVFLLMASTSSELAGWIGPGGYGHKYTQAAGAFFWSAVVLFCALSALLLRERRKSRLDQAEEVEHRRTVAEGAKDHWGQENPVTRVPAEAVR